MTSSRLRLAAVWLVAVLAWCAGQFHFEAVEPHMGTLVRIQLYAAGEEQAKTAFRAAFTRIAQLDQILSDYKEDSELNRICRTAVRRPVAASRDLVTVLEASQKLAEESDGAFDVTLGPVIRLWRQARKERRLPDADALRRAANHCGYRKLHVDSHAQTVMLDQDGMQLDVGGIAKGYAADEALSTLAKLGIGRALVAVSGDLAFGDAPPGRRGWKIGVDGPEAVLELARAGISTSGDTEQYLEVGGVRYSHIVDPATGMGLTRRGTVTVVAPRGMEADGLATAVCVLGAARGMALVEKRTGAAARMVTAEGTRESAGWKGLGK